MTIKLDHDNLTQKENAKIYQATTKPKKKPKRRDKSDLGENFVAPDGGWAWVVCIAAGVSNLSVLPCLQQFGLIFRERLYGIGLTSSQITTLTNTQVAVGSIVGLVNGAMFRRFSFRQVAFFGSICIFCGIFSSAFAGSFETFLVFFSILYGFGMGITMSASSLAVNTYFKNNRRKAMGYSWTITGLGPIILPHVVTLCLNHLDYRGTVLIFAALSLHALMASLCYQPVLWHTKKNKSVAPSAEVPSADPEEDNPEYQCKFCEMSKRRKRSIFSSQYLFIDDDAEKPGFDIIEPGTPMLSRGNDGWHGSKLSLASMKADKSAARMRKLSRDIEGGRLERVNSKDELESSELFKPNHFHKEKEELERYTSQHSLYTGQGKCTCAEEKALLQKAKETEKTPALSNGKVDEKEVEDNVEVSFLQKIVAFFDLDLLRDPIFVNLVLGIVVIIFGELNFSILTPFILHDFGLNNTQISTAMSIIAIMDICVRFLAPFALQKIKWDNKVFFVFGILFITAGRTIVAITRSYSLFLVAFLMIGFGKGFRTLFAQLIIPGYVPLKRLPAASGLQLILTGLFTFSCGPLVGLVTDATNYSVTIHVINAMTLLAVLSWAIQAVVISYRKKNKEDNATLEPLNGQHK